MARIISSIGFAVDVVDRSERKWLPHDNYALFIGAAAGNSGQRYPEYAEQMPGAVKIFYAAGPEAGFANRLVLDRYGALLDRTGLEAKPLRVMDEADIPRCMAQTDRIICLYSNDFAVDSYKEYGLPVQRVYPSTSPACPFDSAWLDSRDLKSFLCFAGNGFIAKGVDLVVEAFAEMPDYQVFIAGPDNDEGFWSAYGEVVERAPNIHFEGFLSVTGRRFAELCAKCAYVILPAAAEGVCTSVATAMRSGLVPVTTFETGIDLESHGFLLPSLPAEIPSSIQATIRNLADLAPFDYESRVEKTLKSASNYTQAGFTFTFTHALMSAISGKALWSNSHNNGAFAKDMQ